MMSHLGGAVGYLPRVPRQDTIAKSNCVIVAPEVRDAPIRFIPDEPGSRAMLERMLSDADQGEVASSRDVCVRALRDLRGMAPGVPAEITIEITTARAGNSPAVAARVMATERAIDVIRQIGEQSPDALVTIGGDGDPLCHPEWRAIVECAVETGLGGVHVRSELRCSVEDAVWLVGSGVDIVSVDLHADTEATYRTLTGADDYGRVTTNMEAMLRAQDRSAGPPTPWLVPRMVRRDAVYSEVELFFDRWVHFAGAAVLDQAIPAIEGDRIEALGKPKMAAWRDWRRRMVIRADGSVACDEFDAASSAGNVFERSVTDVWRSMMETRIAAWGERGVRALECRTGW